MKLQEQTRQDGDPILKGGKNLWNCILKQGINSGVSGEAHNESGHGIHTQKNTQNRPCQC